MLVVSGSRRRIWLAAGAVWLVACAALWSAVPNTPRAILRLPTGYQLLGFGPDGASAVIHRTDLSEPGDLAVVSVPSGDRIATLADRHLDFVGRSTEGHVWLFHENKTYYKLDFPGGELCPLSILTPGGFDLWYGMSPDGRYVLFEPGTQKDETIVWDLEHNRPCLTRVNGDGKW